MSETPLQHPSDSPLDSSVAKTSAPVPPTPLAIALQEYTYWRDCEGDPSPQFFHIQSGALGAAANIVGRISGASLEGIWRKEAGSDRTAVVAAVEYRTLTPSEITRALTEIHLAPRIARVLATLVALEHEPPSVRESTLREAHGLLCDLKNAGVL